MQREFDLVEAPIRQLSASDISTGNLLALYNESTTLIGYTTLTDLLDGVNVPISGGTSADTAVVRWSGTDGQTLDTNPTVFITDAGALEIYDTGLTDNVAMSHDGTNLQFAFTNTTALNLRDGVILRIMDSGDTDWASMSHDGTDFNFIFTNTTDWDIESLSGNVWIRDGAGLKISDSGDTDYVVMSHNGTNFTIDLTNTTHFDLDGTSGGGGLRLRSNMYLRIFDSTNTDQVIFEHDGTNFNITGTNTANLQILGLTGNFIVADGAALQIKDSTNTDAVTLSHDGTNFFSTFTNTGIWYIEDLNTLRLRDGANFYVYDATNTWYTIVSSNTLLVGDGIDTTSAVIEIGRNRTADGNAYIDFHGTTGTDYDARILRSSGADANFQFLQIGDGDIIFTTDGGGTSTFRIDGATGAACFGSTPIAQVTLDVDRNMTGATSVYGIRSTGAIQSDATAATYMFYSGGSVQDSAFTLSVLQHFRAHGASKGASATVTTQYGFIASSSMNEASTNLGFYGALADDGVDYNLYMAGTAPNYLAGNLGIGALPATKLHVVGDVRIADSGNTDYVQIAHDGTNCNIVGTNTGAVTLTGSHLQVASTVYVYDTGFTDFGAFAHDGTDFQLNFSNTTDWDITSLPGNVWIRDGAGLKISDSADTDFLVLSHDGTDFNIDGTNTTSINVNNQINFTAPILLNDSAGSSGQVLTSQGAGVDPIWSTVSGGSSFDSGTRMLFAQTSAPTGWTKDTTNYNEHAIRVVTGTASTGGSVNFTTAFASQGVSGTISNTALSTAQLASHAHTQKTNSAGGPTARQSNQGTLDSGAANTTEVTATAGSGSTHTHTFTGTAINLAVKYLDVITATAD